MDAIRVRTQKGSHPDQFGAPIARAISSALRVDAPLIHASWMTATKAFSVVFRASRNGGK
jgi:hypothetical protein